MDKFIKNNFNRNLIDIIIFHYPCQDGLASAWVAHNYLKNIDKEHELIPIQNTEHTESFLEMLFDKVKDKYVAIFDFAFNLEITQKINEYAKGIIILDHHDTNKDILKDLAYAYFDMDYSGVGLVWNYFYPQKIMPLFLQMIQDRDLWKWSLHLSKDFCDGFYYFVSINNRFEDSFKNFEELLKDEEKMVNKYVEIGKILRLKKDKTIEGITKSNKKIYNYSYNGNNYKVRMVNCEHEIASDLGSALCKNNNCDFAVLWRYDHNSEKYFVSLRSANKVNVSEIAKYYGGGGHKSAAGCTIDKHPIEVFNNKIFC